MVGHARRWQVIGVGAVLMLGAGAARAENLDAGKSAPALFAASCSTCHASPRGLAKDTSGLASFLREHYTASPESAATLAAYLTANAVTPRQAPTGRAAAPSEGARARGRPAETPAAKNEPARQPLTTTARPDSMIEPIEPPRRDPAKGAARGKRQPTKQETTASPASPAEPAAAPAPAANAPAEAPAAAAPVAAAPPPDQPAFSAPSP